MGKIEYLTAQRKHMYDDKYTYYATGYGYFDYEQSLLSTLGDDGWELISDRGSVLRFRREAEEEQAEWAVDFEDDEESEGFSGEAADELKDCLRELSAEVRAIRRELSMLKAGNTILSGLLQALVEKFCPDSPFLLSLKEEMGPDAGAPEQSAAAKKNEGKESLAGGEVAEEEKPFSEDARISGFADEHVERILNGYQDEDKSLELFSVLIGLAGHLPLCSGREHPCYLLKALYRYYSARKDERIAECLRETMKKTALYCSSPGVLAQLNEISGASMTVAEAAEAFFALVTAQLAFEKSGEAPFAVAELEECLGSFAQRVKNDPELQGDEALAETVEEKLNYLRERYGLDCGSC